MTDPLAIKLDERSKALRRVIIKTLAAGQRGHVGAAFSLVEILRVLYDDVLKYDAKQPKLSTRDRFILSKGHGCLALYTMLADKGFIAEDELWRFCKSDGMLGGHPEHHIPGVEASTGSLGHGMSIGLGMALNARIAGASYRTFVVNGHDVNELREVLTKLPLDANKPSAIICHTVKGKGVAYAENNMAWHHQN